MRKIGFRAIHKLTKKKWDSERLVFNNEEWFEDWRAFEDNFPLNLDQCAVMQYTGIEDKNGVEIFEGDVISYMDGHDGGLYGECICIGQVIWDDEILSFQVTNRIEAESYEVLEDCEVIGNIYENPELLEGAAK